MSSKLILVLFCIYLSTVQARSGNSINQDVQQRVDGKSCGPINQKIDQYVNVNGKNCPRSSKKHSGINQNVGQVVSSSGSCSDSEVNQRVHQRVGQDDLILDRTSSQAEDTSSEEIIFKRHHCRGHNDDTSKADSSSEEITIHRGCHSSEYTHKTHSDDDTASEELRLVNDCSPEVSHKKIIKKPIKYKKIIKQKTCHKKDVLKPKPKVCEKSSEETWDTDEVYDSDENRSLKVVVESSESNEEGSYQSEEACQSVKSNESDDYCRSSESNQSNDSNESNKSSRKFCPHCGQNWSCGCK